MDTIGLVDPELRALLEVFPTRMLDNANLAEARERILPLPATLASGVEVRTQAIPRTGAPEVVVHIYKPEAAAPLPCILHMHGGGFVLGTARDMMPVHMHIARELECAIVSVDYRLAPETCYPGNIEDCYAALAWTFANSIAEGFDTSRIGVMGESAGGGLAAALALLARDRGEYRLAFQHLIYPMIDDRTGLSETPDATTGEFIWPPSNNRFGWTALLGYAPGGDDVSPYAAAARAENLGDLPQTFISTGALDLFVDENIAYAQRLIKAAVPVELHVYPGAFHGFDLAPDASVSINARRNSAEALRRFLHPAGGPS